MAVEPLRRNRNRQGTADSAQPQLIAQRVGDMLAEARERRGESIADVSRTLRIRQPYLEALERGDHAALPGPAYAIGFVRAYAVHLDLDAATAVRQFKEEAGSLELAADLNFPTPLPEGRIPTRGILVLALLLTGAAYVGWWFFSADGRRIADLIPTLPGTTVEAPLAEETASTEPTPAPVTTPTPTTPAATPTTAATPAPEPASANPATEPGPEAPSVVEAQGAEQSNDAASPDEPTPPSLAVEAAPVRPAPAVTEPASPPPASQPAVPATATGQALASAATTPSAPSASTAPPQGTSTGTGGASPTGTAPTDGATVTPPVAVEPSEPAEIVGDAATAATEPAAPEANRVFGEENTGSRITVQATGDAWVEFRDGNGDLVFTRVLRPGDSYRVPDMPGLRLQTGNAGALVFQVDGTTLPPIGPSGSVRRNVLIEPEALRDGQAAPPTVTEN